MAKLNLEPLLNGDKSNSTNGELLFPTSLNGIIDGSLKDYSVHFICTAGSCDISMAGETFHIHEKQVGVLAHPNLVGDLSTSPDFQMVAIAVPHSFIDEKMPSIQPYFGAVGRMILLKNPVLTLNDEQLERALDQVDHIRRRYIDHDHPFQHEIVSCTMAVMFLDIFSLQIAAYPSVNLSKQGTEMLTAFVHLLKTGEFRTHRSVSHYASSLCVTAKYLSETCRKATGKSANWWIDQFTTNEIINLLRNEQLTFSEIATRLNFSSISYFSRYVQHMLGKSPTDFRNDKRAGKK